jgi:hypothetical protein
MLRVELAWPDLEATELSAVWAAVAGGERSGGDREGAEMLFRRRWRVGRLSRGVPCVRCCPFQLSIHSSLGRPPKFLSA